MGLAGDPQMREGVFTVRRTVLALLAASMLVAATPAAPAVASMSWNHCTGSGMSACSLKFTSGGQPAGTAVGRVIAAGFGSQGGPVKVEVLDGSGHLATGSTATITVAIGSNPGSGSLSGTVTVHASAGVASFSDLSISKPGIGYTLTANSPGITSATSAYFTIWGSLKHCSTAPCSASSSSATTAGTVTATSAAQVAFLGVGIGGASYTCRGTYHPVSEPFVFDVLSSAGITLPGAQFAASLEISKSTVKASGHPGASSWQICYASKSSFTALPGTTGTAKIGGDSFFTGLLPDCSRTQRAPCVQARHKDNAGDVVVAFLASGDPVGRG
jgi:hypothetical protein